MGAIWLHDLPRQLADRGIHVELWPGWETKSRSSGGLESVKAIGIHHTGGPGIYPDAEMGYMWDNASIRPIGHFYLARSGVITFGAAGATNTQGKGGPLTLSTGTIPLNDGNRNTVSIEAGGNGGEWPREQTGAYIALSAALVDIFGLVPSDVVTHHRWAPGRKSDPSGPTPGWPTIGPGKWSDEVFAAEVAKLLDPQPTQPEGDDDMAAVQYTTRHKDYREVFVGGTCPLTNIPREVWEYMKAQGIPHFETDHSALLDQAKALDIKLTKR